MTPMPEQEAERADREAIDWVLALREAPDDQPLRDRFQTWLADSRENPRAWSETAGVYEKIGEASPRHVAPLPGLRRRRALPDVRLRPRGASPRAKRGLVAAALAGCLLVALATPWIKLRLEADHLTGTGQLQTVALADGSRVELAPASAIKVRYWSRRREVELLRGAAWFDVAHDPGRPFHVLSGNTEVTVLGTAFEVRRERGGAVVSVERGIVRVQSTQGARPISEDLTMGQSLHIPGDGRPERTSLAASDVATWRAGRLVVYDRPVGEVIEAIRGYHGGAILVRGDDLEQQRVTGVFNLSDPAAALQALARAHGDTVVRISPWLLVISER